MPTITPEVNTGLHVRDVTSNLATELEPLIGRVIATGMPVLNHEITGEAPANPGVTGWWLKSFFPITKENGVVVQIGAIVQDITPLERAESAIPWLSGCLLQMHHDERRRLAHEQTRFPSSSHQVSEEKRKGRDYEQSDGS